MSMYAIFAPSGNGLGASVGAAAAGAGAGAGAVAGGLVGGCAGGLAGGVWARAEPTASTLTALVTIKNLNAFMNTILFDNSYKLCAPRSSFGRCLPRSLRHRQGVYFTLPSWFPHLTSVLRNRVCVPPTQWEPATVGR